MDLAEMIKALAQSGINVEGDLVMEKKVEYEVNGVAAGGIGIQVVNGKEDLSEKKEREQKSKRKPGPPKEVLFIEGDPSWKEKGKRRRNSIENKAVCRQEKTRFMQYLAAHKLTSRELNCIASDTLNKVIVCFVIIWSDQGLTETSPSGRAIFRFLTQECNISTKTTEASYANKVNGWLKEQKYDVEIMRKVKQCF